MRHFITLVLPGDTTPEAVAAHFPHALSRVRNPHVAVLEGLDGVVEAHVIGVAHAKWTERPLLVVVLAEGQDVSKEDMLAYFDGKVATWWIPNDDVFVDELPHTATGKIKKIELRKQFADYAFPE